MQNVEMHKHSVIQTLFISSIYQEDLKSWLPLQKLLKILLKMTQKVGYHFKKRQKYHSNLKWGWNIIQQNEKFQEKTTQTCH